MGGQSGCRIRGYVKRLGRLPSDAGKMVGIGIDRVETAIHAQKQAFHAGQIQARVYFQAQ